MPNRALPSPRGSLPRRASPWLFASMPRHGFAGLRFSIALASFTSHFRRLTDLCAALAVRCMSLPWPVIAALWVASASNLMSWLCRRTSSPRPSLPPPRGAMLFFSPAVLSVRGPAHLCPAAASHGFYLPCHRGSLHHAESPCLCRALLVVTLPPQRSARPCAAAAPRCGSSQVHATP